MQQMDVRTIKLGTCYTFDDDTGEEIRRDLYCDVPLADSTCYIYYFDENRIPVDIGTVSFKKAMELAAAVRDMDVDNADDAHPTKQDVKFDPLTFSEN
jgi:hypothetical protein